eukprot:2150273-Pyramimonas_sp.AAC.1
MRTAKSALGPWDKPPPPKDRASQAQTPKVAAPKASGTPNHQTNMRRQTARNLRERKSVAG